MSDLIPYQSSLESESLDFLERATLRARTALGAAYTLIQWGEDGPVSMRHALEHVNEHLDAVETEAAILRALVHDLLVLADRLRAQRDEALAWRDDVLNILEHLGLLAAPDGEETDRGLDWLAASLEAAGDEHLAVALRQIASQLDDS